MKNAVFFICAFMAGASSFAQTIPNGNMESWRGFTTGTIAPRFLLAPSSWFGLDSTLIFAAETYIGDTNMTEQLFKENTHIHSGGLSSKLMTKHQDTLGNFPGYLTNANPTVNASLFSGGGPGAVTFTGGTPVTMKITSVSAYVEYFPGIDTTTHHMGGADVATIGASVFAYRSGVDTFYQIGQGGAVISPTDSFIQVTANITYTDSLDSVALVQIFFGSSGGVITHTYNLDSSTLYVDDVSMTGVPEPHASTQVPFITQNNIVNVYPNPTDGILYFKCPRNVNLSCKLFSVSGQNVMSRTLTGNDRVDISALPAGLYTYSISDGSGNTVQRGTVGLK